MRSNKSDDTTTITVKETVYERLTDAKPFNSMSFSELLNDMVEQYDPKEALED
ncbi:antitoxin VapB family protein [Haloarcula sp. JP-L23]|uniref:antitoxin VapB family protein n=1 Tax=Haloarcula sp. JP-L23 TaxID=2716717 RepID=UPI00140EFAF9|nr:hypothetical protein G9465_03115 [Haloarcula sp. JP-L23]